MTVQHKIARFSEQHLSWFVGFFLIFYAVGITGLSLTATRTFFIGLTPFALLISSLAVALFHRDHWLKAWLIFILIYLLSLAIEIIGVRTGMIFGNYEYGSGLGWKVLGTPLIIGLNWLLLTYSASSFSKRFNQSIFIQALISAFILLVYDLVLEQVAPKLDMWKWANQTIPLQNYLAWFVLAFLFSALLIFSKIDLKNKLAPVILLCQFLFFALLNFILK